MKYYTSVFMIDYLVARLDWLDMPLLTLTYQALGWNPTTILLLEVGFSAKTRPYTIDWQRTYCLA